MTKTILTPKRAVEIQDKIYYNMPSEEKIRITSQFFLLAKKLKEAKIVVKNDARRIIGRAK